MALPSSNRVRIIGGLLRGRVIRFPPIPGLRPTPDRVRETLFNWLGQDLHGASSLDLFAGTGALSLEAFSRGARPCVAVERHREVAEALRKTVAALGAEAVEVHCAEARAFLRAERRSFDVIFLDPPFAEDPWPWLLPECLPRLASGGWIYAEAGRALSMPESLVLHRHARAGQVHYHLLACAA